MPGVIMGRSLEAFLTHPEAQGPTHDTFSVDATKGANDHDTPGFRANAAVPTISIPKAQLHVRFASYSSIPKRGYNHMITQ
jgi:hypothetical protein